MAGPTSGAIQSQEPFSKQIKKFGFIFWVANWMELIERYAYYGVRVVLPVFMVAAVEQGGPQFDHKQKGIVFAVWAIVQSFVPILSGGFADRYGYKLNIAISTCLKMVGYLLMGYCIVLAEKLAGVPLAEARAAGADKAYEIFFIGAMFLATGTAIFKPGVQGLIANQMPKESSALGWGVFYQMVNIGGFTGPLIAGYLRVLDWDYVFLACTAGIALNFIPLFFFKEPERPGGSQSNEGPMVLLYKAIKGLLEPRLFFFTVSFAGFWLMFYQLFDILPNFIDDWVDSRSAANWLIGFLGEGAVPVTGGGDITSMLKDLVPAGTMSLTDHGNLTQEWMINVNAGFISLFAFAMGYFTGKVRSLTAIIVGIAISAVAIYALGLSMNGWWIIGAILLFSLGEMAASPTKMRYLASIAPPGKEGLYMGYVNFTVGIGWSIGSIVAGNLYEEGGDKVNLAKRYLIDNQGFEAGAFKDMAKSKVMPLFEQTMGMDAWQSRQLLWETYQPYDMWKIFMLIGVASMLLIMVYNYVVTKADNEPDFSFNTKGRVWVLSALVPIVLVLGFFTITSWNDTGLKSALALLLNTVFFALMLIIALISPAHETIVPPSK